MATDEASITIRVDIDGLSQLILDYRDYFAALYALSAGDPSLAVDLGAEVDGPDGGLDYMSGYRDALDERLEALVTCPVKVVDA